MHVPKNVEAQADAIVKRLSDKKRTDAITALEAEGFRVIGTPPKERASAKLDVVIKPGSVVRLGVVSDTHIGATSQQITALRDFYAYADGRGVVGYLHGGDVLEGLHVHRDAVYQQYAVGWSAQAKAFAEQYPRSKNGKTQFVDGNHDGWVFDNVGLVSGEELAKKRDDFVYLGFHSAYIEMGGLRILLQHGAKGGGPYGKSYKIQRLLEQLAVEERSQTQIALYGHWHTDLYLGRYQGVFGFTLPCFKMTDRFHRQKGLNPIVGGLVLEVEFTRDMRVWNLRQDWRYYTPKLGDYPGAR